MKVSDPIAITLPAYGVLFAESVHAEDFRMAERTDPYHKLIYVLRGRVAYRAIKREETVAEAGSVVFVPRRTRHQLIDQAPSVLLLLCVGEPFLAADPDLATVWQDLVRQAAAPIPLSGSQRQTIEAAWRRGMAERRHERSGGPLMIKTLAAQIIVQLSRQERRRGEEDAAMRVRAIAQEVDETFYEPWSVDAAAHRAALSRRRFTELFAQATGQTFWDFLTARRLKHAAELLREGNHSVLGVMFSCGFNDTSHFYRLFRRRFGQPPAQWANAGRGQPA